MSEPAFVLLPAFGSKPGEDWFRKAFNWDTTEIYQWLEDVSNGKTGGPRATDPNVQPLLKSAYAKLIPLALPSGAHYSDSRLKPDSHFQRSVNPEWGNGRDLTKSKFRLHGWSIAYLGPDGVERQVAWWNPYDLLGLFLSLLGPAPQAANKNNYFLPLTAVYARWSSRIAGRAPRAFNWPEPGKGAGDWPFMFQCTWHSEGGKKPQKWFFLGASTGGDNFIPRAVGTWREHVQNLRFSVMFRGLQMKLFEQDDFRNKKAPEQTVAGGSMVPYGNCAETYPFTVKVFGDKAKNTGLYGLALMRKFMESPDLDAYDEFVDGVIWSALAGPCRNCSALIAEAGARKANFGLFLEKNQAPVRPGPAAEQANVRMMP